MLDRLIQSMIASENLAVDDVFLEGLDRGNDAEQALCYNSLVRRATIPGLSGVIIRFDRLSGSLQEATLADIRTFYHALRHCGRTGDAATRQAALRLIACGRQGKLAYVISENLHESDDLVSRAAVEAMVSLAGWVAGETRKLNHCPVDLNLIERWVEPKNSVGLLRADPAVTTPAQIYRELIDQRGEIEQAVSRAIDVHRGRHGAELLRAALLLADWPGSRTLAILHTAKHGGQSPMVRRLQQPPTSEHVEAFLLGGSHGGLRSQFGSVFAHIEDPATLDVLLQKSHWLKDHRLQLCVHQVTRGTWFGLEELERQCRRQAPVKSACIGDWLTCSGLPDQAQDERLKTLCESAKADAAARLHLLRLAMARRRGASIDFLKTFLNDPDERLARMAAREILRRRPSDMENILLQLMTSAEASVRRVISRSIGHVGFEHYWERFDALDKRTRGQAGRAMLKLLPDSVARLGRRLSSGSIEQRLKAMQMTQELKQAQALKEPLLQLIQHPHARVRSKAIGILGEIEGVDFGVLLDKALIDQDSRVRANAIEVLESRRKAEYVPLLAHRARGAQNRERANAIKALHKLRAGTAGTQLMSMLHDQRSEHRISAMWALRQIGWWQLLNEVARIAKEDGDMKVRRYALTMLRGVAETIQHQKKEKVG